MFQKMKYKLVEEYKVRAAQALIMVEKHLLEYDITIDPKRKAEVVEQIADEISGGNNDKTISTILMGL